MLIIILGPDGCGKTTIANKVVDFFSIKNIICHHLAMNFEVLPKLRDIINPFRKNKIKATHIEGEYYGGMKVKPSSMLRGMLIVGWYALDYFLGYIKLFKWHKNNESVIFARYYYDYYFQRGYLNTPKWYIRMLEALVPKPDYIFTIDRDAEDIFKLKPELSIEEINKQQNAIRKLLKHKKNAYVINGRNGIDDTVRQITLILDGKV